MGERIRSNLRKVVARIEAASSRADRDPKGVRLLAATKNREASQVREAIEAGVELVGENRVKEMLSKMSELGSDVDWHFIGHLQRNKVKMVVGRVGLIHSVDSLRLAREIEKRAKNQGVVQPVLLQANIAGEESKYGLEPDALGCFLEEVAGFGSIEIIGLSTIAPLVDRPEEVRWVFRRLREIGFELEEEHEDFGCEELSMGMTNDFEVAVEEGATIVRVGTAIFGPLSGLQ